MVGGFHRRVGERSQVNAEVEFFVDLLPFVEVGAMICETSHGGGIPLPQPRPFPESFSNGIMPQSVKGLFVFFAKLVVDFHEFAEVALLRVEGIEGSEIVEQAFDESIRNLELVLTDGPLPNVVVKGCLGGISCFVFGPEPDLGVIFCVMRKGEVTMVNALL
jgi:hypothetical protein